MVITTYIKTGWRNLRRNRRHALLNIMGLAVALAACIIVFLVIQFEYSHNKHLINYKSIYQVISYHKDASGEHYSGGTPFPVGDLLRKDYSQYSFAELMMYNQTQITAKNADGTNLPDKKFYETAGIYYGNEEAAKLFELKFITGSRAVLKDVDNAILSRNTAEKYFGTVEQAMGKRINFNNEPYDFQVMGVFEDTPDNSDFSFHVMVSYSSLVSHNSDGWPFDRWDSFTNSHQLYVLLPGKTDISSFNDRLGRLENEHNNNNKDIDRRQSLLPLADIHFDERFNDNGDHSASKTSLYVLSFIGLLIILMACINFVNLSTSLAVTRSKEAGVRKVMGGSKAQLRLQVFIETGLIVCMAVMAALLLAYFTLPYVKEVMVVQSPLQLFNPGSILFLFIITLAIIFLSGLYPAFIMGRFKPVEALRNQINTMKVGSVPLRRVLVVLQFSFSQLLIIATIVAVSQMNYIRNTDLGFTKEAVMKIVVNSDSGSIARYDAIKNELLARQDVKAASFSFEAPAGQNSWSAAFKFDNTEKRNFEVNLKFGDADYANTYDLQMIAGRFYEPSDTPRQAVVNEAFLKRVGITDPHQAIGKIITIGGRGRSIPVVGVVRDFHHQSLKGAIEPLALIPRNTSYGMLSIRLNGSDLLRSKAEIKGVWAKYFPEYVYDASFIDDSINSFYTQEERLSRMYKVYALLAIFISCLGLYGLISFMVVQKTREVGIRKVLGASIQSILYLFSKEFIILISMAFVLAAPVAWYLMNNWLEDFTYRINIGAGVFIAAIGFSLLVAGLTVGYKSLKAALANPVKSLRTE